MGAGGGGTLAHVLNWHAELKGNSSEHERVHDTCVLVEASID